MSGWMRIAGLACVFSIAAACCLAGDGGTYTAEGVVLGPDGQAVGGARIGLYLIGGETRFAKELTTGRDGRYAFSVPAGTANDAYGLIVAHKEGLAWNCLRWLKISDLPIDIRLPRPEILAGTVVDEQARPIAGAKVSLHTLASSSVRFHYVPRQLAKELFTTETDYEGRFRFATLSADWRTEFLVEASGYGTISSQDLPDHLYTSYTPGQPDIQFVLRPEATVRGRVVSETDGKPLSGITVQIGRTWTALGHDFESTVSDRAGAFSFGAIPEGDYWVGAATSYVPDANWVGSPFAIQTKAGDATEIIELKLTRGGMFEVKVVDRQGAAVADAWLTVFRREGRGIAQGRSNAEGLFRTRLPAGSYELIEVGKRGYHTNQSYLFFDLEHGQTIHRELTLKKAEGITGIVTDENGRPVSGVQMTLMPGPADDVVTDKQGRFVMTWTQWRDKWEGAPNKEYELIAVDLAGSRAGAVVLSDEPGAIRVVLKPAVHVTGTVVDGQGKPIAGAVVFFWLRGTMWGMNLSRYKRTATDRSGRFRFGPIHPDRACELSIHAKGYEKVKREIRTPAQADRPFDLGRIKLMTKPVNNGQ